MGLFLAPVSMGLIIAGYCFGLLGINRKLIRKYSRDHKLKRMIEISLALGLCFGILLYGFLLGYALVESFRYLEEYWVWGFSLFFLNAIAINRAIRRDESDYVVGALAILITANGGIFAGAWLADGLNMERWGLFGAAFVGIIGAVISGIAAYVVGSSTHEPDDDGH